MVQDITYQIPNRKIFFNFDSDSYAIRLNKSWSWLARMQRQQGFEQRLEYEFKFCKEVAKGQVFFVTLTYNDAALHKFHGFSVPDKTDIQYLFNHSTFARNIQKQGFDFKYFVSVELGNGGKSHNYVGVRGVGNNPHYHCIIFLYPRTAGLKISPRAFIYEIKKYWQGTVSEKVCIKQRIDGKTKYKRFTKHRLLDWRNAKFGHVSISRKGAELDTATACRYTAKYSAKDIDVCNRDKQVIRQIWLDLFSEFYTTHNDKSLVACCIPVIAKSVLSVHLPDCFAFFNRVQNEIKTYKNLHSTKSLISNNVGEYACKFVNDLGFLPVTTSTGSKLQNVCTYLFRKCFCKVYKSRVVNPNTHLHNLVYVKTKKGIDVLYNRFIKSVQDYSNFMSVLDVNIANFRDKILEFGRMRFNNSDLDCLLYKLTTDGFSYKCALYNLLYRNKFFADLNDGIYLKYDFDLFHSFDEPFDYQINGHHYYYKSYEKNSYFASNVYLFDIVDIIRRFFMSENDKVIRKSDKEDRRVKKEVNSLMLKAMYV